MKFKRAFLFLLLGTFLACGPSASVLAANDDEDQVEAAPDQPSDSQNAAQSPPITSHVAGSYLSSQFAKNSGNSDLAISSLQQVHRDEPNNMEVALQLQGLLLVQGRVQEAMKLADDIDRSGTKDPLAVLLLSLREITNGDNEAAADILNKAADMGSNQLWLPLLQAWVDVDAHKLEKPLTVANINSGIGHDDSGHTAPLVNYHLALINSEAGFKDEAIKDFKAAIVDPKDPPMRVMKQLLRFYGQNDAPEQLSALVKEYREAHAHEARGEFDVENEGNTAAITTAKDGAAEILYTMGGIMYGAGIANDAAIYLQLAVYVKPDMSEAIVALGDTYSQLQQYKRANDMYARIAPQNFLYAKAQLHIAVNDERMGEFKRAISLLDSMAKQSPDATEALVTKGDLLRIHGKYSEAVDAYSAALKRIGELKPIYWPLLFARGACYEREGKWAEAEKDLQAALELKPDQPDILNYLAFGWLERGENLDEAKEMIARALKARPDDAQIIDSMGWALYMDGEYTDSSSYLEKAVELLPGDPAVNDHLGDVYWRLDRKDEARFQWERALSFSPEKKEAHELNQKIKEGLPPDTTEILDDESEPYAGTP